MLSMGKFIFSQKMNFGKELEIILKCKHVIQKQIDSEQSAYAYIATLTANDKNIEECIPYIFKYKL